MGRVTLESALGRRSVRTVLAAGLIPATLLLFGLAASRTPPPAAIEPAGQGPQQEERPLTRSYHGAAVVNGKIYLMGGAGEDNKPFASVQVYDPATGTWAARANMPTARGLFGTSAVGGTIYVVGGTTIGRSALSSSVVDGRIYVMGGAFHRGPTSSTEELLRTVRTLSVVEIYDPASGRWTKGADLATARGWFATNVVDGRVYVVGGRSVAPGGKATFPGIEVYTPTR